MGSWVHDKVHVKSLDFFEPCAKAAKKKLKIQRSQQGLLVRHLLPECVGRGLMLGSEISSADAAGVWESGHLEIMMVHHDS